MSRLPTIGAAAGVDPEPEPTPAAGPALLYSGYSNTTPNDSIETPYDLATTEVPAVAEYLSVNVNGTITINKAGVFRFAYRGIIQINGTVYVALRVDGVIVATNQFSDAHSTYQTAHIDISRTLAVGAVVQVVLRRWTGSGNKWLAAGTDRQSGLEISKG